ncbi:MAG: DNA polymerase III subunit alpha [Pseudomonadota bacterium]
MANQIPFIHLAVRSSYSLLDSMITTKSLANWTKDQCMPAIAVADRNNLFGALERSEALSDEGVQPIMACLFDVVEDVHRGALSTVRLYAQNEVGYRRLMELASAAYLEASDGVPKLAKAHLFERTDGLLLLTGGADGQIAKLCAKGKTEAAETELLAFAKAYPDRTYVELTRHGTEAEQASEAGLLDLAYAHDLPIVATHDARFITEDQADAHDALMCISNGEYLGQEDRQRVERSQYLKTADEMRTAFVDLPEALEMTAEIAQRCAVKSEARAPILPNFSGEEGRDEIEELKAQAKTGLEARLEAADQLYATRDIYFERLDYELGIIEGMGFPGYFLIVSDFIKWAKEQGIPVGPGRGSGAGSLVAWSLLITDLDPLRFDLLFERFLNPERVSMPDFDIDFCQERRGEVIRYVRDKYGADSVAMIITFGTLQAKAVVRDVGRVMQMGYGKVDGLAKLIPFNPANPPKLADAIADEPKFQEEKEKDPRVGELLDTALKLEGLYRNAGTHAAGVVIADRPLTELVPLFYDPRSDLPASQFNMKWAEIAGLVKFDFLGLKTLTVIDRALGFIRRDGRDVGPDWQSLDDPATYELMASGETLGVFQLEGQGMRDTLRRVKPGNIEDVIAIISLYRPGPMDNIPVFCDGKEDPSKIRYQHRDLKPILEATYGVPVYQEQVMRMAQELAGYSLGEADLLRRAMGKKKKEEMDKQRARFVEGCANRENTIDAPLANEIFDTMAKFAGYGFNKSHAAAYALIGYQTAYLKRHFPVEFLAASMSLDLHNTDKLAAFFMETKRLGLPVIAPDVNQSTADFDVCDGQVVYALGALKGVGLEAMKHLVEERDSAGPYKDLHDLAERVDPKHLNKKAFEQLAKAGALVSLDPNRAQALAAAPMLAATAASAAEDRAGGQGGLFGDADPAIRAALPTRPAWNQQDQLDEEFNAVGFYLSGHPLDDVLQTVDRSRLTLVSEIGDVAEDRKILEMVGVVRARVEKPARSGGKFAFLKISDPSGEVEMMVMPEMLGDVRDRLEPGSSVSISVEVRKRDEEIRLSLARVIPLEEARLKTQGKTLRVRLGHGAEPSALAGIMKAMQTAPGTEHGQVIIDVPLGDGRVAELTLPSSYPVGIKAIRAIKSAAGVETVQAA